MSSLPIAILIILPDGSVDFTSRDTEKHLPLVQDHIKAMKDVVLGKKPTNLIVLPSRTSASEKWSPKKLASYLDVSISLLRSWRSSNEGPAYLENEDGSIEYDTKDVLQWLSSKIDGPLTSLPEGLWSTSKAARYLGEKPHQLHRWRYLGKGPKTILLGSHKNVRYIREDLQSFENIPDRWSGALEELRAHPEGRDMDTLLKVCGSTLVNMFEVMAEMVNAGVVRQEGTLFFATNQDRGATPPQVLPKTSHRPKPLEGTNPRYWRHHEIRNLISHVGLTVAKKALKAITRQGGAEVLRLVDFEGRPLNEVRKKTGIKGQQINGLLSVARDQFEAAVIKSLPSEKDRVLAILFEGSRVSLRVLMEKTHMDPDSVKDDIFILTTEGGYAISHDPVDMTYKLD